MVKGENVNDNTTMLFIIEEAKETILDFSQIHFNIISA